MAATREEIPDKLKPFVALGFDWHRNRHSGKEYYGDCPFCGRHDKFYINEESGQWSCKSGHCAMSGNVYTFMEEWWKERIDPNGIFLERFEDLANEKEIPSSRLRATELVWDVDDEVFALPVRNRNGTIVNIYRYVESVDEKTGKPYKHWKALYGMDHGLYGAEQLAGRHYRTVPVFICEGLFDKIAMEQLLEDAGVEAIVLAVPGEGVFKDYWAEWLTEADVILCYDHDKPGRCGAQRAGTYLVQFAETVRTVQWSSSPEKWDVRDHYRTDRTYKDLMKMVVPFTPENGKDPGKNTKSKKELPLLSQRRVTLDETFDVYSKHLRMTDDMRDALRIIYAVIYSNQIYGDPLWMFIAAPPGGAKTELLMSCSQCSMVVTRSTLTPHILVSGFQLKGNRDPSLIPKLIGNVFILKDWTEVLDMNRTHRDEIYGTLRGAYDGEVEKSFGNGTAREYKGYFSMAAGVTHAIYREQMTSLGERFLTFWMPQQPGEEQRRVVLAAMENVGEESEIKTALCNAAKNFLEYQITSKDVPSLSMEWKEKIAALAQLVAILRAKVEKEYNRGGYERILYRPQHEVGTRIAKQLVKLALGLALQHSPPRFTDDDYRIVKRVALSSCSGWNIEVLQELAVEDGRSLEELTTVTNIPKTTLRDQMEDLVMLGALSKSYHKEKDGPGRGVARYWFNDDLRGHWTDSGLPIAPLNGRRPPGALSGILAVKRSKRGRKKSKK